MKLDMDLYYRKNKSKKNMVCHSFLSLLIINIAYLYPNCLEFTYISICSQKFSIKYLNIINTCYPKYF